MRHNIPVVQKPDGKTGRGDLSSTEPALFLQGNVQ